MLKSIIVAQAQNRVIGQDNQLPWHLPADLRHFRRLTMGHHVLMGRKTFEGINRPLPGRKLIVLTRMPDYQAVGCTIVQDLASAWAVAERAGETEVFIAGGAAVYCATLALADKIYLTAVQTALQGDCFFPEFDRKKWQAISHIRHPADEHNRYAQQFIVLERRS